MTQQASPQETTEKPAIGTPEYDQQMVQRFEQSQQIEGQQTETPAEPELILGKFKTQEDLIKSYQELERRLSQGQKPTETPPANTQEQAPEGDLSIRATTGDNEAEEAVVQAGLDFDALTAKFTESGKIDDSDYEALQKAGISKQVVDNYIAGQMALGQQRQNEVYSVVGGQENYTSLTQWAGENLTPAEIEAYNRVVDQGDINATKLAVQGLQAKFVAAGNGPAPKLVQADNGTASAEVYESVDQMKRDMANPLYRTDPAFRAKVAAKLGRSNIM